MKKSISAAVLALTMIATLGLNLSAASAAPVRDIRVQVQNIACQAQEASNAPLAVSFDKDALTITVVSGADTVVYDVIRMTPGMGGMIFVNGYSQTAGWLQMNIIPNGTTMILHGSAVSYVTCAVN